MEYAVDQLTDCQAQMLSYWETVRLEIESIKCDHSAFKTQDLPLARIKKIMKLDDEIKSMMISAEAPILFAKAAELFIRELTLRAWIHTERNRRRTLQRNDIAMAVSDGDTDQFDFLIDIVPREEVRGHRRTSSTDALSAAAVAAAGQTGTLLTDANGNSIPVVQVVAPTAGGFSLPTIVQDANGQRTQLVQLQMPEASTGRPTLFLQQSGSVLGATALLAGGTLDGHSHRIAYNIQPQQLLSPTDVVTGDVASQVLLSFTDSGTTCMISSDASGSHCLDATDALEDVSNRDPHELVEEPGAEDDSAQVEATNSPTHSVVEHASLIAVTKQTEVDFELDSQVTQQELLRPVVPLSPTGEVELHGLNSGLISDDSVKTKLMDSTTETPNMDDS
ncbi:unnamed protein product [Dicrocoelium dendriticum]|nr:unnamed protein product [Dicrocoelium dendriticum]